MFWSSQFGSIFPCVDAFVLWSCREKDFAQYFVNRDVPLILDKGLFFNISKATFILSKKLPIICSVKSCKTSFPHLYPFIFCHLHY